MFQRSGGRNRCFDVAAKNIRLSHFASTLDSQTLGTEKPRGVTVHCRSHCTGLVTAQGSLNQLSLSLRSSSDTSLNIHSDQHAARNKRALRHWRDVMPPLLKFCQMPPGGHQHHTDPDKDEQA